MQTQTQTQVHEPATSPRRKSSSPQRSSPHQRSRPQQQPTEARPEVQSEGQEEGALFPSDGDRLGVSAGVLSQRLSRRRLYTGIQKVLRLYLSPAQVGAA